MQDMYTAGDVNTQPNTQSFRSVLLAWSLTGRRNRKYSEPAALRAQHILEWMVWLHNAGENDLARPDAECFDIVLHTWAASGHQDASRKTEKLLLWMEQLYEDGNELVKPRISELNQVLMAWSRSREKGSAQWAHDILRRVERISEEVGNEDIRPNGTSYGAVAYAWAKSAEKNSSRKAESILKIMEQRYMSGELALRPYTGIFNVVIESFAKSNDFRAYTCARAVLDRQIVLYQSGLRCCKPDVYGYTSVISSCAATAGPRTHRLKAFDVAEATFRELCLSDYGSPNHVTFGTMLKACAYLLPPGCERRSRLTKEFFLHCIQMGCVGDMVLTRLKDAASPSLYNQLLGSIEKNDLPLGWTWNIPDDKQHKKWRKGKRRKHRNNVTSS